jgi:hypothetical protein
MKTFDELEPVLENHGSDFMDGENPFRPSSYEPVKVPEGFEFLETVECVEQFGGEGQGDQYFGVWKFGDIYIKFYGWYASHAGSEYEGMKEVKPVTKTITVYE